MTTPVISIVIPSYNRPAHLAACLEAIGRLDYPREEFEVLVVDDGSKPPLRPGTEDRLLRQENNGPGIARNFGASEARGKLIVFIDDDCRPRKDWLRKLEAAWRPGLLVSGALRNAVTSNRYAAFNESLVEAVMEWFAERRHPLRFLTSSNLMVEAKAFHALGGFRRTFRLAAAEDREFSARWTEGGGELRMEPEAVVEHYHAQTFRQFLRMHFRYGRGAALFHGTRGSEARPLQSAALYGRLLLRCRPWWLLPFSQAATAAGYWFERRRSSRSPATTKSERRISKLM